MTLTNTSRPSAASLTNSSRAASGVTWALISTTWATETGTWADMASVIDNIAKSRTLGSYTFLEIGADRIDSHGGRMDDSTQMINTAKPS